VTAITASPNPPPDQLAGDGTARNANGPEVQKLCAGGLGAMLVIQVLRGRIFIARPFLKSESPLDMKGRAGNLAVA
jgi:hypothetical protein